MRLLHSVYELLDIPVSIEDLSFKPKVFRGISSEEYDILNADLRNCLMQTNNGKKLFFEI